MSKEKLVERLKAESEKEGNPLKGIAFHDWDCGLCYGSTRRLHKGFEKALAEVIPENTTYTIKGNSFDSGVVIYFFLKSE